MRKGIHPKFMLEIGDPANMIIEIVNSKYYVLVVLGTCGMNIFKELFLGQCVDKSYTSYKMSRHDSAMT